MKPAICILLLASMMWSCKNNAGYIEYFVRYTTEDISLKSGLADPELYHTGMGDYITSITPSYFEQEFEVPAGYGTMQIIGQNGTYTTEPGTGKRYIKICHQPLIEPYFGVPDRQPWGYFFGNTESTYVFNRECAELPASEDSPNGGRNCMIRSHQFTPLAVTMPEEDETIVMYSTVSFNTDNLIQVYAGMDNTPYTQDDVFTYAPNYWERLKVRLEVR